MNKWYNINGAADGAKSATVNIFDQIGESWFGEGVSAKGFVKDVDALGDLAELNVHINSPGGNVYDGLAIYNYLRRHSAQVNVYIDGIAASMASIIAMAGDRIVMPKGSFMFIHNPWTFAGGNADELRKAAADLDNIRDSMVGIYMDRSTLERDDIIELMDGDTLMDAEEALGWGFASELEEPLKAAASAESGALLATAKVDAAVEAAVMAKDAVIKRLETEKDDVQAQLTMVTEALEEANELMNARPRPASAEDVIEKAKDADMPEWLATHCISNKFESGDVVATFLEYQGLRDVCAAAGIEDADEICRSHYGDNTALISALLLEVGAAADEGINTRLVPGADASDAPRINFKKAYASRKPHSQKI